VLGNTIQPGEEDGTFIEFDEDGIPFVIWVYDPDEEVWLSFDYIPYTEFKMPQTGDMSGAVRNMTILVAALALAAITQALLTKKNKNKKFYKRADNRIIK